MIGSGSSIKRRSGKTSFTTFKINNMKKYISTTVALLLAVIGFSQHNAMDKYFTKYSANDDYTHITIAGKMFELMTHIDVENEEEQEIQDALSGIHGIEIAMIDSLASSKAELKSALSLVGRNFESLMSIDDKNAKVEFIIQEYDGVVKEMLIIGAIDGGFGIVDIWGDLDLKSISNLTQKMEVMGMEHFDGEKAEASRHINFYPNPMMVGTDGNMRVPEELMGTTLKVTDLNGRTLSETKINAYESKVPLGDLPMGSYIVSIWDGKNRIFNEKVVLTR